ncbi:DUF2399 domain-containing protein [Paenibacillus apiarius]|uniref:DUF2399 domain-containing protein n=1 Tax=Paenibacillus apiarius TaxID=46240 RepID=A0ABT4DY39_9BACL|nr:DUF2399 domain-containing protein [Paenibacillus apiarius]MCY9517444.1 DUF2399 domain-containing protein [Paenibacillus apiarius]MCY9522277.1 DUF2399 domain-containing protein [Paenibacillus apiarius]MCY9552311.1 DUF2399 domain-containing protein [Paenibacillus apiarius]MCY9560190.1 DUF2399 domain-containing protein [Paenibacillus apiarius]MCY9683808.1 DUF2399 domain-containing protein [Paenibacillus apiarius]
MEIGYHKTAKQYYSDPLLGNLLNAVFKKYQGQNGIRGNAKIVVRSDAEADRLQHYFGNRVKRLIRPHTELVVPLKIFSEELELGYKLNIPDLYEVLYEQQLLTKSEQRELKDMQWIELFERVNKRFEHDCKSVLYNGILSRKIFNWYERLKAGSAPGYQILKGVLRNGGAGDDDLFYCVKALWYLFYNNNELREKLKICTQNVRIPIFSNFVTQDPHRFDLKFPAGRLLLAALEDIYAQKIRTGEIASNEYLIVPEFMKRRQIYRTFGLMDDDISSISHVFASSFIYGTSPRTLNLREIESREDWPKYSALYILENPSVFSFLVDETLHFLDINGYSFEQLSGDSPPLICTSGQARSATKYFIRRSLDANPDCEIFYSGDFDLPGVQMLVGMEELIQGKVNVFRMDSDTYRQYIDPDSLPLSMKDKKIFLSIEGDLAKTMAEAGVKVYQESTVGELKEDWIEVVSGALKKVV